MSIRKKHTVRSLSGIMTVEMAYLMPVLLLIFQLVVYSAFYYHDKMILLGAAGETAVIGAQYARKEDVRGEVNLQQFFQEQITGKLILFSGAEMESVRTGNAIEVSVLACRGRLRIGIVQHAVFVEPEKRMRRKCSLDEMFSEEKKGETK